MRVAEARAPADANFFIANKVISITLTTPTGRRWPSRQIFDGASAVALHSATGHSRTLRDDTAAWQGSALSADAPDLTRGYSDSAPHTRHTAMSIPSSPVFLYTP